MDSTKYIGRVGALAVALGIGTALTSGTGVAWADETGGDAGKTSSSSGQSGEPSGTTASAGTSPNVKPNVKKPSTSAAPNRRGPLSRLGDRVRKDVESGLDTVGDAVKRTQSRLDKSLTQVSDTATKATTKATTRATTKSTTGVNAQPAEQAGATADSPTRSSRSLSANRSDGTPATPEATATVPDLGRAQRPATVVVRIKEAAEKVTETIADSTTANSVGRLGALPTASTDPTPTPLHVRPGDSITTSDVPVTTQVSAPVQQPRLAAPPVVSALLAATGLSPLAGTGPTAPAQSPALWAVMAWARRESERSVNPNGTSLVSATEAASVVAEGEVQPLAAVSPSVAAQTDDPTNPQVPLSLAAYTDKLGWVTGPGVTGHWYVAGTDLGIMWNSGYTDPVTGKPVIYTLFGDTYSEPGMAGDWRNNVLFRTSDADLTDGLQFTDALIHAGATPTTPGIPTWYGVSGEPAGAAQVIYDPGYNGFFGTTYTMIPTSAIAIENTDAEGGYTQYATVMSVRTWDNPGSWTTNYSAIAYSNDGGKTWTVNRGTVRSSGWLRTDTAYVPGDEHFQQNALVMSDDPADPYVYVYGTPSGRQGSAYLARVKKDQITNLDSYEYWSGENSSGAGRWVTGDPSAAVPVFGASSTDFLPTLYRVADFFTLGLFTKVVNGIWVGGLPTNGNVSEMSVQYNKYLGKYVVLYTDGGNNVVMRVSGSPQGQWSDTTTLVSNNLTTNTGMYAPMVHPMSGTDYFNTTDADGNVVEDNSQYLYYNLSYWGDYNVQLMRTDLASMKTVSV